MQGEWSGLGPDVANRGMGYDIGSSPGAARATPLGGRGTGARRAQHGPTLLAAIAAVLGACEETPSGNPPQRASPVSPSPTPPAKSERPPAPTDRTANGHAGSEAVNTGSDAETKSVPHPVVTALARRGITLPTGRGGTQAKAEPRVELSAAGTYDGAVAPGNASIIAADVTAPFEAFRTVIAEMVADGDDAHLLVSNDDALRSIEFSPPPRPAKRGAPELRVTVQEDGYRVTPRLPGLPDSPARPTIALSRPAAPLTELDRWDTADLADAVADLEVRFPDQESVTLCAEPPVPVGALVAAADVLLGPGCDGRTGRACRFTRLSICAPEPEPEPEPATIEPPQPRRPRPVVELGTAVVHDD